MNSAKRHVSAYTNSCDDTEPRFGEITECELCEDERLCTDRFGMLTCRRCQADFLP